MKKNGNTLIPTLLIISITGTSFAALTVNYTKKSGESRWADINIWSLSELPGITNSVQVRKQTSLLIDTVATVGGIRIFESASLTVTNKGQIVVNDDVDGNGSILVGYSTPGALNLAGGLVNASRIYFGFTSGGQGLISDGTLKSSLMYVGKTAGSYAAVTQTGGQVIAENSFNINYEKGANGIYQFKGGVLTTGQLIFRNQNEKTAKPFDWADGELRTAGIIFSKNWAGKNPVFTQNSGTLCPTTVNLDGSISEISSLEIQAAEDAVANYTLTEKGRLHLQIADGKSYDQLVVEGCFTAGGALDVTAADPFNPANGDRFLLIKADKIKGAFSKINLPELDSGLSWDVDNLLTQGILTVK